MIILNESLFEEYNDNNSQYKLEGSLNQEKSEIYHRFEVFDDKGQNKGGIFRGLNQLLKDLWDADSEYYDYINDPLSKLEWLTPNPENINDVNTIFAYKESFYNQNEELFEDIEYALNEIDWELVHIELSRPDTIVYEDDTQIAYNKGISLEEEYDPPYNAQQIKDNYGEELYNNLIKDPAHRWRMETGIELIHKEPTKEELERIWRNWQEMSKEQKEKSDKKSLELFGKTNEENYYDLIKLYESIDNSKNIDDIETPEQLMAWMEENITYELANDKYGAEDDPPTKTAEEVIKTGTGHCAEQSYLEYKVLDELGYFPQLIFVKENNSKDDYGADGSAHMFVVYQDEDEKYTYFEHSQEHNKGIHKFDSMSELLDFVGKNWWRYDANSDILEVRYIDEPITGVNNWELAKECHKYEVDEVLDISNNVMEEDVPLDAKWDYDKHMVIEENLERLQEKISMADIQTVVSKINKLPKGNPKVVVQAVVGANPKRPLIYIQAQSKFDRRGQTKYLTNSEVADLLSDFCSNAEPIIREYFNIDYQQVVRYVDGFDFSMMYDISEKTYVEDVTSDAKWGFNTQKIITEKLTTKLLHPNSPTEDNLFSIAFYDGDTLIGGCTLSDYNNYPHSFLSNFEIEKEYRGMGYGSQIIQYLIDNYDIRYLNVDSKNHVAINLYKKFGFKIENESSNYRMVREGLTEAKKRKKKKISQVNPGEAIFKSVKDMQKWVKKRQKGWGSFVHIDNCGNMDYNNDMFNKMHGLGDTPSSSTADGGASDAAPSGGDVGGSMGMGESLEMNKDAIKLSPNLVQFMKEHRDLINEKDWDTLFLDYAADELSEEDQSQLVQVLISIGCDIEVIN